MSSTALLSLADDLAADRQISSDEALRLRKAIFPDGVVSRQEADVLLSLAERVSDADPAWSQAFVEAIVDHVLQAGVYPGHVDAESTAWLARSFAEADRTGVETLLKIAERAESAPDDLMAFMRARVFDLVAGQPVSADGVELVRRAAYASGGAGGVAVNEAEVRWLFAVDAACDGFANDPAWQDVFVKVALCHVVGRSAPKALEHDALVARTARTPRPVTAASLLSRFTEGGVSGFFAKLREPGFYQGVEDRYAEANVAAETDARFTAVEAAAMLGLSDEDGKRTANETALLTALAKLEAEQGAVQ